MDSLRLRSLVMRATALSFAACGSSHHAHEVTDMDPATGIDGSVAPAFDASALDASAFDASLDAHFASSDAAALVNCQTADSGIVCDDGKYCTGSEVCNPADPRADARGCVASEPVACASGQTCSDLMQACSLCHDDALDDNDHDGHESQACGGDDCRDDDADIYRGHAELCDGKDNDCDGTVDGASADSACMAAAPALATSSCQAGSCAVVCTDPDSDLVAGACVHHDDCAGVTACAPGSCVDGVRSFTCTCPSGYRGTGTSACADVDECESGGSNDCDQTPASCVNDPGSFHCACPATHFGDGVGASGCTRKAVAVAAGDQQTCAVLQGGQVKCWGSDTFGKLGYGTSVPTPRGGTAGSMGDALPYVALGAGRSARALAVGSDVTCGVLDDGSVKCWGYNGYYATGASSPSENGISSALAPLPSGQGALQVAAGSGHGYALLADGRLGGWGQTFAPYVFTFVAPEHVQQFDRSPRYDSFHVCAVIDEGALRCFPGNNTYNDAAGYGALGWAYDANMSQASYPKTNLGTGRTAKQVATGDAHSCALLDDGSVKCWGRNDHGQLGLGDTQNRGRSESEMGDALPTVPLGANVSALAAGANHTCALYADGSVKCWGANDRGQLGQGSTGDIGDEPGELAALAPVALGSGRKAVAIDVGSHSCALLDQGGIKCWGPNASGELGQGDTLNRGETPGSLGDALKVIDVGG